MTFDKIKIPNRLLTDTTYLLSMELSNTIRKKMDDKGMTIKHLSDISNISEDTIKAILYHRVKDVKLSTAIKLANAFDCSLDELFLRS